MKVAILALDIVWANPEANLESMERLAAEADEDVDLLVLPELFTTGFIQDSEVLIHLSERTDGLATQRLRQLAKSKGCAIAGSMSATDDGLHIVNRAFFISSDCEETYYDKRHLFSLSAENRIYTAGNAMPPVINYRGWNIALMICYDLRFPVWSRNCGLRYDMMLVPANWPQARGYAWEHLLIARAIENQAVYVGADRSGTDDYGCYDGLSEIYDAMGKPVGDHNGQIVTATVDLENVQRARRRLPTADSADDFNILCL